MAHACARPRDSSGVVWVRMNRAGSDELLQALSPLSAPRSLPHEPAGAPAPAPRLEEVRHYAA